MYSLQSYMLPSSCFCGWDTEKFGNYQNKILLHWNMLLKWIIILWQIIEVQLISPGVFWLYNLALIWYIALESDPHPFVLISHQSFSSELLKNYSANKQDLPQPLPASIGLVRSMIMCVFLCLWLCLHVVHALQVDVAWFYRNCLTDTCNCNRGGDCECLCTSIAAYAHKCCQQGVTIHWRSPSVCREYAQKFFWNMQTFHSHTF